MAGEHIKSFGNCSVTGSCKMETDLYGQFLIWFETYSKVILGNAEALLEDSYCFCPYGGKITIFDSKQIDNAIAMTEIFGETSETLEALEKSFDFLQEGMIQQLETVFDEFAECFYNSEAEKIRNNINNPYMQNNINYGYPSGEARERMEELDRIKKRDYQHSQRKARELNLNNTYMQMQTGGTGWNPNVTRNGEKVYQNLSQGNNSYMQMQTGLSEQMLEAYLRSEVKPNTTPPEFGIRELFRRGTSREGIGELYSKGMDSQNKKMLPGLLGGDPEIAANLAGYTYFSQDEVQKIVESLTPDGKAAYLLHTRKNMALTKFQSGIELGQQIYAIHKSLKGGKVKTGKIKNELTQLDDEITKKYENSLKSSQVKNTERASKELLDKVSSRRDVVYAKPGTDDLLYLEMSNADGLAGGEFNTDILLRENPSRLTVVEEFLHGTQVKHAKGNKIPLKPSFDVNRTYEIKVERHVRDFMYRHRQMIGFDEIEIKVLKGELDYWNSVKLIE